MSLKRFYYSFSQEDPPPSGGGVRQLEYCEENFGAHWYSEDEGYDDDEYDDDDEDTEQN